MQTPRRNRLRGALLWIVVAGLWVAIYPSFYVSKREFALILLAMFFTFGVQNFERDPEGLGRLLGSDELPIARSGFAKWWLKYRTPAFLFCANACIALIAIRRILRIWHAELIR